MDVGSHSVANEFYKDVDNAQSNGVTEKPGSNSSANFNITNQNGDIGDYSAPTNTAPDYERFKPRLHGNAIGSSSSEQSHNHVYISPRISLRSKHTIRDSREEEHLPAAKRTKLEVY